MEPTSTSIWRSGRTKNKHRDENLLKKSTSTTSSMSNHCVYTKKVSSDESVNICINIWCRENNVDQTHALTQQIFSLFARRRKDKCVPSVSAACLAMISPSKVFVWPQLDAPNAPFRRLLGCSFRPRPVLPERYRRDRLPVGDRSDAISTISSRLSSCRSRPDWLFWSR